MFCSKTSKSATYKCVNNMKSVFLIVMSSAYKKAKLHRDKARHWAVLGGIRRPTQACAQKRRLAEQPCFAAPAAPCLQECSDIVILMLRRRVRMRAVRHARAGGSVPQGPRPEHPAAARCGGSASQAIACAGTRAGAGAPHAHGLPGGHQARERRLALGRGLQAGRKLRLPMD